MNVMNGGVASSPSLTVVRFLGIAQGVLATLGLAVVLVLALPALRDILFRHSVSPVYWSDVVRRMPAAAPSEMSGSTRGKQAIVPDREQKIIAEFLAKRYLVADEATTDFVSEAFRVGKELAVDPLLLLAVMGIESRYNPIAESSFGAKGLMQIIPKFHPEKLANRGGENALLEPAVNIQVGAMILKEYMRRYGELRLALQVYAGGLGEVGAQYAAKVLGERSRLERLVRSVRTRA